MMTFFMKSKASFAVPVTPDSSDLLGIHVTLGSVNGPSISKNAVENPSRSPAKSFPIRRLDRDEVADLMRRGEAFIASGDLASARLVLQRAAEAGDPRAALTLADPLRFTNDPLPSVETAVEVAPPLA